MINNFRFFCQKVLPIVYDDSLSYIELMYKVIQKINEITNTVNTITDEFITEIKQAVDEWIEEHGLTITIPDNSIELVKLTLDVQSKINSGNEFNTFGYGLENAMNTVTNMTGIANLYAPQGFCYDPDKDVYIYLFAHSTNSLLAGVAVESNKDGSYILRRIPLFFGHGNSIDYIPDTKQYIISTGLSVSDGLGHIQIYDNDYNLVQKVDLEGLTGTQTSAVAYDAVHDSFYVMDNAYYVHIYDRNFNKVKTIAESLASQNIYDNVPLYYNQGCCCWKGNFIRLSWFTNYPTGNIDSWFNAISYSKLEVFNYNGDSVATYYIPMRNYYDESEDITVVDDHIVMWSYYDDMCYNMDLFINKEMYRPKRSYTEVASNYVLGLDGKVRFMRIGSICTIRVGGFINLNDGDNIIMDIPEEYKPAQDCFTFVTDPVSNASIRLILDSVANKVQVYKYGTGAEVNNCGIVYTYPGRYPFY